MTLDKAEEYLKLWNTLFPGRQSEDFRQFALWATSYSESSINIGFRRAVSKFTRNPNMDIASLLRYAGGVMHNTERPKDYDYDCATQTTH